MRENVITLRFLPDLTAKNAAGTKTRTTRIGKKGEPGNVFFNAGICYRLVRVEQMDFLNALVGWEEEGYKHPLKMAAELTVIYGTGVRHPGTMLWAHWYEKWQEELSPAEIKALDALEMVLTEIALRIPESEREYAMKLLGDYVRLVEGVKK